MALTPVAGGRFEIYLNGDLIYNRREPPDTLKDPLGDVRNMVQLGEQVRTKLLSALEAATAAAAPAS